MSSKTVCKILPRFINYRWQLLLIGHQLKNDLLHFYISGLAFNICCNCSANLNIFIFLNFSFSSYFKDTGFSGFDIPIWILLLNDLYQ